jgi:cell division protein FtsL
MKETISTQQKKNESLAMKINELASLDKIKDIVKTEGLSYNKDNIKTIISE